MIENQTNWRFYEISFQQTRNGERILADRYYENTSSGIISDDQIKRDIGAFLKDPSAVITFLEKKKITAEEFCIYTGHAPWDPNFKAH